MQSVGNNHRVVVVLVLDWGACCLGGESGMHRAPVCNQSGRITGWWWLVLDWGRHPARGGCGIGKAAVPKQVGASVVCGVPRSVCGVQLWTS